MLNFIKAVNVQKKNRARDEIINNFHKENRFLSSETDTVQNLVKDVYVLIVITILQKVTIGSVKRVEV